MSTDDGRDQDEPKPLSQEYTLALTEPNAAEDPSAVSGLTMENANITAANIQNAFSPHNAFATAGMRQGNTGPPPVGARRTNSGRPPQKQMSGVRNSNHSSKSGGGFSSEYSEEEVDEEYEIEYVSEEGGLEGVEEEEDEDFYEESTFEGSPRSSQEDEEDAFEDELAEDSILPWTTTSSSPSGSHSRNRQ